MLKILLLDIETSPYVIHHWKMYDEFNNPEMVIEYRFIMCWAAKWLNEKKIMSAALPDFESYKKDTKSDKELLLKLVELMNEADLIIAHNGNQFDFPVIKGRLAKNRIIPTNSFVTLDTCLIARKQFGFMSNKLGELGKELGV